MLAFFCSSFSEESKKAVVRVFLCQIHFLMVRVSLNKKSLTSLFQTFPCRLFFNECGVHDYA
jgi:hypothetical protein